MSIFKLPSITTAQRTVLVLQARELVFDTNLNQVFRGDGVTAGGLAFSGGGITDGDKGDIDVSGGGTVWGLDAAIKAALRDRALHTGTQPASSIADLTAVLDAKRYRHDQVSSSATWTVNHNLGFRPQCQVFSPGWVQIEAAILHTSDNQTVITFNSAQTGQAIFT